MKKQNLEIIIEQVREIGSAFSDIEDNMYQIQKALEDELKDE